MQGLTLAISQFLPEYPDVDEDTLFRMFTTRKDVFLPDKLEKDFYLTLLLIYFWRTYPELIFKGGTCLNKIYYQYYRLSEDLDFVIEQPVSRTQRKTILEHYKQEFKSDLFSHLGLNYIDQRTKFNEDTQGCFEFTYRSIFTTFPQTIQIDIRIEPVLLLPPVKKRIWSIFLEVFSWEKFFHIHTIHVLDLNELLAEKMRAALTRMPSAIRDFFDIHYARKQGFDFDVIRPLIREKVGNLPYSIEESKSILKKQIKTELNPVLQQKEKADFNFEEIYNFVLQFKI